MTPPAPSFVDCFAGSGDGGKPVFEDAKDRHDRVDLLEKAGGRFGWRVRSEWTMIYFAIRCPVPSTWKSPMSARAVLAKAISRLTTAGLDPDRSFVSPISASRS